MFSDKKTALNDGLNECSKCGEETKHFQYMLKMLLGDSMKGEIEVLVYQKNGEKLFGLPPVDLNKNNVSCQFIQTKMNMLKEGSPWMSCCIKSYEVLTEDNEVQVRYQLFDTKIVDK